MTAVVTRRRGVAGTPFTLEHFEAWCSGLLLDSDEPFGLDDYQRSFAEDVFSGFAINWLVVPEESGKTTFVGAFALYHIEHTASGYVPVAASARDQAEWIYRQAEGFVYRSGLRDQFRCLEGYRRIRCDAMGSRIQVFAADDRSGDGIIPTLAVIDELHRHKDLALYRTWVGKLRKRGGQLIVISTAGEAGGEFELERQELRRTATEIDRELCFTRAARRLNGKPLSVLHDWSVPDDADIEDLAVVKAANPSGRVTVESLREKRAMTSSLLHWSRFTCNRATRSSMAAITELEWFRQQTDEAIPSGIPIWLGLDLGWKWDTTALVPLWWRDPEFRLLGPARVVVPPRDGSSLDPALVEAALLDIHGENPIEAVVMDITKGEQMAEWIRSELGAEVVERGSSLPAQAMDYSRFMEALRQGWLWHVADDDLTRHALNGVARQLPRGDAVFDRPRRGRQSRDQDTRVIDALDAAAMVHAVAVAEHLSEPPASAGWRGV